MATKKELLLNILNEADFFINPKNIQINNCIVEITEDDIYHRGEVYNFIDDKPVDKDNCKVLPLLENEYIIKNYWLGDESAFYFLFGLFEDIKKAFEFNKKEDKEV